MSSGQCGCPRTVLLRPNYYTGALQHDSPQAQSLKVAQGTPLWPLSLLHPYVRTEHLEMLFSVQNNCEGVTAKEPPFEVGGWDNGK